MRVQAALQHDFRSALESVGNDARVLGGDDFPVALHLKAVLQRVRLLQDRAVDDVAVQLQALALPRGRVAHDLVDVLVVFRSVAQRGVQQAAERQGEDERRHRNLDSFSVHMGLRAFRPPQNTPRPPAGQSTRPSSLSMRLTVASGSPTTFDHEPSIQSTKRAAWPWIA